MHWQGIRQSVFKVKKNTHQQTIGTRTYFFENICFLLIHVKTFALLDGFLYKSNHKESRYVKPAFLSSEKLLHKLLQICTCIQCKGKLQATKYIAETRAYSKRCSNFPESSLFFFRLVIISLHLTELEFLPLMRLVFLHLTLLFDRLRQEKVPRKHGAVNSKFLIFCLDIFIFRACKNATVCSQHVRCFDKWPGSSATTLNINPLIFFINYLI